MSGDHKSGKKKPLCTVAKSPKEVFVQLCQKHALKYEFIEQQQQQNGKQHLRSNGSAMFLCGLTITAADRQQPITVQGFGSRKKNAEHHACLLMMKELKDQLSMQIAGAADIRLLPAQQQAVSTTKTSQQQKRSLHPVSRLCQIAHAKQAPKQPQFECSQVEGGGKVRFRCTCSLMGDNVSAESDKSGKHAKLLAAELMLSKLGFKPAASAEPAETKSAAALTTLPVISELSETSGDSDQPGCV